MTLRKEMPGTMSKKTLT
jgi:hypothetical protein